MRKPNEHDQPVEGGEEIIDRALHKQSDAPQKPRRDDTKSTPKNRKKDEK